MPKIVGYVGTIPPTEEHRFPWKVFAIVGAGSAALLWLASKMGSKLVANADPAGGSEDGKKRREKLRPLSEFKPEILTKIREAVIRARSGDESVKPTHELMEQIAAIGVMEEISKLPPGRYTFDLDPKFPERKRAWKRERWRRYKDTTTLRGAFQSSRLAAAGSDSPHVFLDTKGQPTGQAEQPYAAAPPVVLGIYREDGEPIFLIHAPNTTPPPMEQDREKRRTSFGDTQRRRQERAVRQRERAEERKTAAQVREEERIARVESRLQKPFEKAEERAKAASSKILKQLDTKISEAREARDALAAEKAQVVMRRASNKVVRQDGPEAWIQYCKEIIEAVARAGLPVPSANAVEGDVVSDMLVDADGTKYRDVDFGVGKTYRIYEIEGIGIKLGDKIKLALDPDRGSVTWSITQRASSPRKQSSSKAPPKSKSSAPASVTEDYDAEDVAWVFEAISEAEKAGIKNQPNEAKGVFVSGEIVPEDDSPHYFDVNFGSDESPIVWSIDAVTIDALKPAIGDTLKVGLSKLDDGTYRVTYALESAASGKSKSGKKLRLIQGGQGEEGEQPASTLRVIQGGKGEEAEAAAEGAEQATDTGEAPAGPTAGVSTGEPTQAAPSATGEAPPPGAKPESAPKSRTSRGKQGGLLGAPKASEATKKNLRKSLELEIADKTVAQLQESASEIKARLKKAAGVDSATLDAEWERQLQKRAREETIARELEQEEALQAELASMSEEERKERLRPLKEQLEAQKAAAKTKREQDYIQKRLKGTIQWFNDVVKYTNDPTIKVEPVTDELAVRWVATVGDRARLRLDISQDQDEDTVKLPSTDAIFEYPAAWLAEYGLDRGDIVRFFALIDEGKIVDVLIEGKGLEEETPATVKERAPGLPDEGVYYAVGESKDGLFVLFDRRARVTRLSALPFKNAANAPNPAFYHTFVNLRDTEDGVTFSISAATPAEQKKSGIVRVQAKIAAEAADFIEADNAASFTRDWFKTRIESIITRLADQVRAISAGAPAGQQGKSDEEIEREILKEEYVDYISKRRPEEQERYASFSEEEQLEPVRYLIGRAKGGYAAEMAKRVAERRRQRGISRPFAFSIPKISASGSADDEIEERRRMVASYADILKRGQIRYVISQGKRLREEVPFAELTAKIIQMPPDDMLRRAEGSAKIVIEGSESALPARVVLLNRLRLGETFRVVPSWTQGVVSRVELVPVSEESAGKQVVEVVSSPMRSFIENYFSDDWFKARRKMVQAYLQAAGKTVSGLKKTKTTDSEFSATGKVVGVSGDGTKGDCDVEYEFGTDRLNQALFGAGGANIGDTFMVAARLKKGVYVEPLFAITSRAAKKTSKRGKGSGDMEKNSRASERDPSLYREFRRTINMSSAEITRWRRNPQHRDASLPHIRAELPLLAQMKSTPMSRWTPKMWNKAMRAINFVKRHEAQMKVQAKRYGTGRLHATYKRIIGLLNWGRKTPGVNIKSVLGKKTSKGRRVSRNPITVQASRTSRGRKTSRQGYSNMFVMNWLR